MAHTLQHHAVHHVGEWIMHGSPGASDTWSEITADYATEARKCVKELLEENSYGTQPSLSIPIVTATNSNYLCSVFRLYGRLSWRVQVDCLWRRRHHAYQVRVEQF